jgi:hypothetical protein
MGSESGNAGVPMPYACAYVGTASAGTASAGADYHRPSASDGNRAFASPYRPSVQLRIYDYFFTH